MYRSLALTLPADTNAHNLWDLIVAANYCDSLGNVTVSTDKVTILPDRVEQLTLTVTAGTITFQDRQATGGTAYTGGASMTWRAPHNTVCLKDRFLKGAAGGETFVADLEAM